MTFLPPRGGVHPGSACPNKNRRRSGSAELDERSASFSSTGNTSSTNINNGSAGQVKPASSKHRGTASGGMPQEPELAHPSYSSTASATSTTSSKVSSREKAYAKSLRNAGKEVRVLLLCMCLRGGLIPARYLKGFLCAGGLPRLLETFRWKISFKAPLPRNK